MGVALPLLCVAALGAAAPTPRAPALVALLCAHSPPQQPTPAPPWSGGAAHRVRGDVESVS
jgi:hypothetical protein